MTVISTFSAYCRLCCFLLSLVVTLKLNVSVKEVNMQMMTVGNAYDDINDPTFTKKTVGAFGIPL